MKACVSQHMDGDQRLICRDQFSTMWVPGTESRSSGWIANPLHPRAISVAPEWLVLSKNIYRTPLKLQ